MHEVDGLHHRLLIQVVRVGTGTKPASTDIDRVRSRVHCSHHALIGTGRCEDFNRSVFHSWSPPLFRLLLHRFLLHLKTDQLML